MKISHKKDINGKKVMNLVGCKVRTDKGDEFIICAQTAKDLKALMVENVKYIDESLIEVKNFTHLTVIKDK